MLFAVASASRVIGSLFAPTHFIGSLFPCPWQQAARSRLPSLISLSQFASPACRAHMNFATLCAILRRLSAIRRLCSAQRDRRVNVGHAMRCMHVGTPQSSCRSARARQVREKKIVFADLALLRQKAWSQVCRKISYGPMLIPFPHYGHQNA